MEKESNSKAPILFAHKKNRPYDTSHVVIRLEDFKEIMPEFIERMKEKYSQAN
ncbi:hypothetical protein BX659_1505 [Orenia metallireducens]|jgi:hypothetical protein|uniref:hypothetical protein n=1 Tax=Orenia metallireducens TaxID=1413210 RepID=UPI000D496C05|nr:hypothetical protein [Orenia metallireducens]PRX17504.1 hypothetical protein BX659_1505 [Orenia metallireducens]